MTSNIRLQLHPNPNVIFFNHISRCEKDLLWMSSERKLLKDIEKISTNLPPSTQMS